MPPARPRALNDDPKVDTRDRSSAVAAAAAAAAAASTSATGARPRKTAAVNFHAANPTKDGPASAATNTVPSSRAAANGHQSQAAAPPGLTWTAEDSALLHSYRNAYGLAAPPAFRSALSAAVLNAPGIGRHSPTMARARDRRKVHKDQLALAVRKHFNGLAVTETDVVVDFLYAVRMQDRGFKMRFAPRRQR